MEYLWQSAHSVHRKIAFTTLPNHWVRETTHWRGYIRETKCGVTSEMSWRTCREQGCGWRVVIEENPRLCLPIETYPISFKWFFTNPNFLNQASLTYWIFFFFLEKATYLLKLKSTLISGNGNIPFFFLVIIRHKWFLFYVTRLECYEKAGPLYPIHCHQHLTSYKDSFSMYWVGQDLWIWGGRLWLGNMFINS